jgi:hypothetical protein
MADYLTRADLETRVQYLVDDQSATMLTMIRAWMDMVYREAFRIDPAHGPLWTVSGPHSVTLTGGTSTYPLSTTDPGKILAAKIEGPYRALEEWTDDLLIDNHYSLAEVGQGLPEFFRFRRQGDATGTVSTYLDLFRTPDSGFTGKKLYYSQTKAFAALSTSASVPLLPLEFQDVLVWGTAHIATAQGVDAMQVPYAQKYERGMKGLLRYNWSLIPRVAQIEANVTIRELG